MIKVVSISIIDDIHEEIIMILDRIDILLGFNDYNLLIERKFNLMTFFDSLTCFIKVSYIVKLSSSNGTWQHFLNPFGPAKKFYH